MSDIETADRISRSRARIIPVLAVIFLTGQAAYFSQTDAGRTVDHVRIGAWFVWSLVLLTFLATGGGFIHSKRVRALMNDEVTRANRMKAYAVGFWAVAASLLGLYVVALFDQVSGRDAIHISLSAGIAAALLTFGFLERRALKDG